MSESAAPKPRRSQHHERFIAAFLESPRTVDVANAVGVSQATVRRWKARPECWSEVEARRGEFLDDAVSKLRRSLPKVTDRLVALALDEKSEPAIAVRASCAALDAYAKLASSTEIEKRLAGLEEQLRGALGLYRPLGGRTTLLTPVESSKAA